MKTCSLGLGLAVLGFVSAVAAGCDGNEPGAESPPQVAQDAVATALEDVVCDLALSCDCSNGRQFQNKQECRGWAQGVQAEVDRLVSEYGLTWEPTCVGWYVQGFEDNRCASANAFTSDADGDDCNAPCAALHGSRSFGQACQLFEGQYSDCDTGLFCNGETCAELCPEPARPGESCGDRNCDETSFCAIQDSGVLVCTLKAEAGDDCFGTECGPGLRCVVDDPTAVMPTAACQLLAKNAEACMGHGECDSGYCPAGFCEAIPKAGDSCRGTQTCAEGLWCVEDICGEAKQEGDACQTACGGGLACLEGVCKGANAAACFPGVPL